MEDLTFLSVLIATVLLDDSSMEPLQPLQEPKQALLQHFGHSSFRPGQEEIISNLIAGKNTLATLPTGSGKSITFQLPVFLLDGIVLVISPLLSLIRDQVQKLTAQGIAVAQLDSTLTDQQRLDNLQALEKGELKILYTSPETLASPQLYPLLKQQRISLIAIDEAHCYSEWGHSFRPSYLSLPRLTRALKPHAILALTATATRKVASDIRKAFQIKTSEHIAQSPRRKNLHYHILPTADHARQSQLSSILAKPDHLPAIVYAMKQEQCEEISGLLAANGFNARSYHAGMSSKPRRDVQDAFINGKVDIIVATIAFGMGVDKSDIRSIIHYHLPKSPEGWLQESGRAGRDGELSNTYLLACGDDLTPLDHFTQARDLSKSTLQRLVEQLASQGKTAIIQPYQVRVQLDLLTTTLDILLAKLELMKLISYSHTSWRYAQIWQTYGRNFQLSDYPKKHQTAVKHIITLSETRQRYDLHDSLTDFNIPTEKLFLTLQDIKESGECRLKFSGWQKHYNIKKTLTQELIETTTDALYLYHQEQLQSATTRLNEVHRITTTKACIPLQLEKWFSIRSEQPCGSCTSCTAEKPRLRKLPTTEFPAISDEELDTIHELLRQRGKRLNNPQKLTRFLCGIPTPYLRHFFLYKDSRFGLLKHHPYEDILAYATAMM